MSVNLESRLTKKHLVLSPGFGTRLVDACRSRLPAQSFGVFLGPEPMSCRSFRLFKTNIKDRDPAVRRTFAAYGPFYGRPDKGFWVEPSELLDFFLQTDVTGERITACFHTHQELDASPTAVDRDLHFHRGVPIVILSFKDPGQPLLRAFTLCGRNWQDLEIVQY